MFPTYPERPNAQSWMRRTVVVRAAIVLVLLVGLVAVGVGAASAHEYRVVKVVDGDTIDVVDDGEVTRIRLLNIDAPESVDPARPVQCLGPEASARLAQLLPEGTVVSLEYDAERADRYGRTLAGVYLDGELVNAKLVSEGLAVPLTVGENDRLRPEVDEAWRMAESNARGFFDPDVGCTAPAQVAALEQLFAETPVTGLEDIATTAATITVTQSVVDAAAALRRRLADATEFEVKAISGTALNALVVRSERLIDQGTSRRQHLEGIEKDLKAKERARADAAAKARAKAKAEAKAEAKAKAAAKRKAAANAEARAKARASAAAKAQAAAEAARAKQRSSSGGGSSTGGGTSTGAGGSAPYPGYTGPRCYAPGGKSWKPC